MSTNHDEYGNPDRTVDTEFEADGTIIKRPPNKVITFHPEVGYGEAVTSDPDLMKKRTDAEFASKETAKKKTTSATSKPRRKKSAKK